MHHQPGLDVVRTAAIALVLLRHGWIALDEDGQAHSIIELVAANGWLGVDLFFALSGFLVARSFWNKCDAREFLLHRIARIFPAYFFFLLLIFLAPSVFVEDSSAVTPAEIVEHVLFVNDYSGSDLIVAFWTLAVEIKFYAIATLAFMALRGWNVVAAAIVLSGLSLASTAARLAAANAIGVDVDYLIFFHDLRAPMHVSLDGLFLGAAAGTLTSTHAIGRRSAVMMCGLGALGILALLTSRQWMTAPGVLEVAAVPCAAAVCATLLVAGSAHPRLLPGSQVFRGAAELTFAIYLVHMSTIPWSKWVMGSIDGGPMAFTLCYLSSSIALAGLLHRGVERPARRFLLERFARPTKGFAPGS